MGSSGREPQCSLGSLGDHNRQIPGGLALYENDRAKATGVLRHPSWDQAALGKTSPAIFIKSSLRSASFVCPAIHDMAFERRHFVLPAGRL
jgi:hypothetical protein